jgi:hypothetical protein
MLLEEEVFSFIPRYFVTNEGSGCAFTSVTVVEIVEVRRTRAME